MSLIHLVDDDIAVTDACRFLLESLGYKVKVWHDGEQFLAQADLHQSDVLLLDIRMPLLDGTQVYARMRQLNSTLAVIFLTAHGEVPQAVEQMKLGAVDFLQKPVATAPLMAALQQGLRQSELLMSRWQVQQRYALLTPREQMIAQWVMQGLINRDIADKACVSVRTVEVHRAKVMEKMAVSSLAELVSILNPIK
ncbi:tetrathionate respiration response regulator TtrR [Yersinia alsatica]|uniref:Tetrathionate respiration response regulator TtrR n=1 Tax=Yersinia alsatica TaxID=2890317 RepID=A0ABY5UIT9_9GAMM|nr:tetrathionate respiration response regulator TtrR [Yersinia alsatica]OWF69196.1 DNA-binding response regulator [Yersinia frederiksenii]UWM43409.1 tetrathionate respiration response regulator TtrR [Yersinia alsatica]CNK63366.1 tetrathionate reductase complex: two-component system response regulator [Yersinia frederiksenii]CNK67600.1 tetrathionate reductase complex: two-component system response regulator [Yersinia frederiksenii]